MWLPWLAVACGGTLGATARLATVTIMQKLLGSNYPYGTLVVNCIGSFLAGLIMIFIMERLVDAEFWRLFLVVGFLGAYTTFSSFSWETWMLYQNGYVATALGNILFNNVGALVFAFIGMRCGRLIGSFI